AREADETVVRLEALAFACQLRLERRDLALADLLGLHVAQDSSDRFTRRWRDEDATGAERERLGAAIQFRRMQDRLYPHVRREARQVMAERERGAALDAQLHERDVDPISGCEPDGLLDR